MKDYEPRYCEICGSVYKPCRANQRTCGSAECVKEMRRQNAREWQLKHYREKREMIQKARSEVKPDTIVAIGYAERQKEQTLAMAGKVRTEL